MKKTLILALFFCFSCQFFAQQEKQSFIPVEFVEGSQDIPLAKGLKKVEDGSLTFDSLTGNVLSISYKTDGDVKNIKDFYIKTLPQMGWKKVKGHEQEDLDVVDFKRDNERLEIEFSKDIVRFYAELGV